MNKWIVVILIFLFSVILRAWNLNEMGRTWDEPAQAVDGYNLIRLAKDGNFFDRYWYDHPDHPPLTKYLYGLLLHFDIKNTHPTSMPYFRHNEPTFYYDWTYARTVSIFFSSLTIVFVVLFGWHYISAFVGIIAGIILAMLPFLLGLSQLATIESILIFFFTVSVYSFLSFLKKSSIKNIIQTGILIGLALGTKYTNALLYPILIWILLLWFVHVRNKEQRITISLKVFVIFLVSVVTFFLLWPMPWFHLKEVLTYNYNLRIVGTNESVPEIFFGKLILVPKVYYLVHFLITTPFFLLVLFLIGLLAINKKIQVTKKWIMYVLVIWFVFPFIQSLYNFRQHGIRYIIEIYAPFSLIAAFGFDYIVSKFTKSIKRKILYFVPVAIYMFMVLVKITPYYLDYFNILVGGTKGVYEKRLFQLGWWGQGIKEAVLYVAKNASPNASVGLAVEPLTSVPQVKNLVFSKYSNDKLYDYVLVSYFMVTREGFDDSKIKKNYNRIYSVSADGASLVDVYKQ